MQLLPKALLPGAVGGGGGRVPLGPILLSGVGMGGPISSPVGVGLGPISSPVGFGPPLPPFILLE